MQIGSFKKMSREFPVISHIFAQHAQFIMQKYPLPSEIEAKRSRIKAIHGKVIRSPATKTHARTIISHIAIAAPPDTAGKGPM